MNLPSLLRRTLYVLLVLVLAAYVYVYAVLTDGFVRPPEIARGLPNNFEEASLVLEHRLRKKFPEGSSVSQMIAELKRQGFSVSRVPTTKSDGSASFGKKILIGKLIWMVWWRSEQDRIAELQAYHACICL